ncbi:MAG: TfoX/Sxy family protein [Pseudomonadota bacterium]
MASSQETVDYIVDQMSEAGTITARKMFGEYGVYCDGKIVGLICRDQLFLKPTDAGTGKEPDLDRAPAYEGAKPSLVVPVELLDDRSRLGQLVRKTANALPSPKPKKKQAS